MSKVAVILLNYNMPEVIEQNVDYLNRAVETPHDIFLLDQSGAYRSETKDVTLRIDLSQNLHATHGYNLCLRAADSYTEYNDLEEYFAYFVVTTTGLLDPEGNREDDVLAPLVNLLNQDENAVIVQPAHRADSIGFWEHLKDRGTGEPRRVWMIEHSAALFRGEWFRDIGFMEPQIHIHGPDLWYSYLARVEGKGLYVHEGTWIKRHNDNMHEMGRSFEGSALSRTILARKSFERFGQAVLGPQWEQVLMSAHVDPAWR